MNDAASMRGSERVGDLDADQQRAFQLERMAADKLSDVAAFDVLHGDEVVAFRFVEIEDGADVWMIERGGQPRFAFKAFEVCFSRGQLRRQDFDDDGAAKFCIGGFVNRALPANAELFQNLIIARVFPIMILCKANC